MGYLHQSQRVFTPLSQARLEHIDVVRLKKGGCRFEVACFKNKLVEWRRGIETNLSDVLQSEAIFDNVSRGKRARDEDIQRVFGTQDIVEVATFIMTKGAIHLSESIRVAEHDRLINPMSAIEQTMQKIHVALTPHEPADIQPKGQKRLTNVAIVRLKKGGCRFEVACYKNKVVNWRNKIETQLDEVLQSHDVFVNVSKGKRATADDMRKVFGTDDVDEVAKLIIDLGELQVSDGERAAFNQSYVAVFHVLVEPFLPHERHTCSLFQEIATIVAEKCVNPESNRPYPRAMKEIHYSLIPNRSAKQQALEVISKLQDHMPITRAKMKVQVSVPAKDGKAMKKYLEQHNAAVLEQKGTSDVLRLICLIDPGAYRGLDAFVLNDGDNVDGSRSLEVLELSCHEQGEHSIDAEISKKTERLGLNADAPSVAPPLPSTTPSAAPAPVGRPCSTCGGAFVDTALYRQHFRSEWHRYNLKLKAKKRPVIDQAAFDTLSSHDVQRFFETLD
ncbi:hypothetical protein DYB35_009784 [Aphanomyces astaci]|uniref:C2H2-type domain-containing protein n=1 Tax=Aphanomyces astaci TaxID=112090 RepID=A0A3R7BFE5_APHAT|nr:hypothetical protein DYB35_009784 [Aphanomyces astaci]